MSEKFLQDIVCKRCAKLLGYAPYYRTDYLCVTCNGPVTDADFEEIEIDESEVPY